MKFAKLSGLSRPRGDVMAHLNVKMPDDFMEKISRLAEKTDDIVPRVLQAGADIVEAEVRSRLEAAIGSNTQSESRSTGELLGALGASPAKLDRNNNYNIKIGFNEPRKDGCSNAMIANILEHGSSNQPARPFLKPARTASSKSAIEAMKTALEREIENI